MVSGIVSILLLVMFVGAWIWAWSPRRKHEFDSAAQLPLDPASTATSMENRE